MSAPSPFVTVFDLALSPDEERLWGGLPRTPVAELDALVEL